MTVFKKNGMEIYMPENDDKSRQNMIIAAEFMARMIQKYGKKVLAKIEKKQEISEEVVKTEFDQDKESVAE